MDKIDILIKEKEELEKKMIGLLEVNQKKRAHKLSIKIRNLEIEIDNLIWSNKISKAGITFGKELEIYKKIVRKYPSIEYQVRNEINKILNKKN